MKLRGVDHLAANERHQALADARLWAGCTTGREALVLIEPDEAEAARVTTALTHRGVRLVRFSSPWHALAHLGAEPAAIVVASARLGSEVLTQVVEAIKQETTLPVLIAYGPSNAASIGPAVMAGGRPIVELPYDPRSLIHVLSEALPQLPPPTYVDFGRLSLVPEWQDAHLDDRGLGLSRIEYTIVAELVRRGGRCASRGDLISAAWPSGSSEPASLLTAAVKRIRIKFASRGLRDAVETVRGVGYRLNAPVLLSPSPSMSSTSEWPQPQLSAAPISTRSRPTRTEMSSMMRRTS